MRVGFVGLGIMGAPLAGHLQQAGHELAVWTRRRQSAESLCSAGAVWADSVAILSSRVDVLFTMVAADADVEAVLLGEEGALAGAAKRADDAPKLICVDMTTIAATTAVKLGQRLSDVGVGFVDAPVSGGETGAKAATLSVMVGGDDEHVARVMPLLQCFGRQVVHVGGVGAGQIAKAANQIVTGMGVLAVAEALALAKKSGVDPARVRQALLGGFAKSPILEQHGERMLAGNTTPGFKAWMHRKDLDIVLATAAAVGIKLPGAATAAAAFAEAVAAGQGELDSTIVFQNTLAGR